MARLIYTCIISLAVILMFSESPAAEFVTSSPAAAIGSGASHWIDTVPDPEFSLINARVDVGTLRQVGDAIEAQISRTLRLGILRDFRAAHPDLKIPDGSQSIDRERIVCREDGPLSYRVEAALVAPDGKVIDRQAFAPAHERLKSDAQEARRTSSMPIGYHPDPISLVCWAVARKCEDKPITWPPPQNKAPLEYSEPAARMRAEYNRMFVPRCQL
jgi:hypothetical protein